MQPLVISRLCIVTGLGAGLAANLAGLRRDMTGLKPCTFDTVTLPTYVGEVAGVDDTVLSPDLAEYDCRNNRLAQLALQQDGFAESVAAAREKYGDDRIGVFLGTSTSGILQSELAYRRRTSPDPLPADFVYAGTHNSFSAADFTRRYFRLTGPATALSAACASSAKVFATAARMIAAGLCDAAIVGGVDSLCLTTLYGFHSLDLLSPLPCRPFDVDRAGISIGEAAGFALLEKPDRYEGGDATLLLGVGESSDAYHMSSPHPEGLGARLAMTRALAAANLSPDKIDYVNLHGTATAAGDASEDRAITNLFGLDTPCSSTKGWTGHTLGAAGIVEAIIAALSIEHNVMPGGIPSTNIDPALKSRYVVGARDAAIDYAMTNSFGFGGANCSLILGRAR